MRYQKYIKKFLCVILICITILFSACAVKSGPEKALENFEKAFNERDLEGIIAIYPPDFQSELKLQFSLAQGLAGLVGVGDLFSDEIIGAAFGFALEGNYIEIDVLDETYSNDNKNVTVKVKFTSDDTSEISEIEMQKIGDEWYFADEYVPQ